jgi:hypothetical protein
MEETKMTTELNTVHDRNAYQAYQILRWGFVAAPLLAGADKFFHLLVDWNQYLSPLVTNVLPVPAEIFMKGVGVVEIAAAVLVAIKPRIGGYVVSAWLIGIILNLLSIPGYFDIALRDLGLSLGALALARLSEIYDR